jgi:hypothetical protein
MADNDLEDAGLDDDAFDDEGTGTEGEGTEGQDQGDGDAQGDVSPERADAPSEEDLRQQGLGQAESPLGDQQSRGRSRQARLSRENADLRARIARMEGANDATAQYQYRQRQEQAEWEHQQRRSVMTPEEAAWDDINTSVRDLQTQRQWDRSWLQGQMDKNSYDAKAAANPTSPHARYLEKVEALFAHGQKQGQMWPREMILRYLIGDTALTNGGKQTNRARAEGRKRIEANTTRPTSARGDASSTRSRSANTAEGRLRDVDI